MINKINDILDYENYRYIYSSNRKDRLSIVNTKAYHFQAKGYVKVSVLIRRFMEAVMNVFYFTVVAYIVFPLGATGANVIYEILILAVFVIHFYFSLAIYRFSKWYIILGVFLITIYKYVDIVSPLTEMKLLLTVLLNSIAIYRLVILYVMKYILKRKLFTDESFFNDYSEELLMIR